MFVMASSGLEPLLIGRDWREGRREWRPEVVGEPPFLFPTLDHKFPALLCGTTKCFLPKTSNLLAVGTQLCGGGKAIWFWTQ